MKYKKIIIWLLAVFIFISIFIGLINIENSEPKEELATNEYINNQIEISEIEQNGEVTDDCLNEWQDYAEYVNKNIEVASSNITENDTHYILKDVLGYIEVYYLDENNEQYLYKKTSIPTKYLSQEDIEDLKIGIEVTGIEALNKMLEDFE